MDTITLKDALIGIGLILGLLTSFFKIKADVIKMTDSRYVTEKQHSKLKDEMFAYLRKQVELQDAKRSGAMDSMEARMRGHMAEIFATKVDTTRLDGSIIAIKEDLDEHKGHLREN